MRLWFIHFSTNFNAILQKKVKKKEKYMCYLRLDCQHTRFYWDEIVGGTVMSMNDEFDELTVCTYVIPSSLPLNFSCVTL